MNIKLRKRITTLLLTSIVVISLQGCKKTIDSKEVTQQQSVNYIPDNKLMKFISVITGTAQSEIKYNKDAKEFIIERKKIKVKLEEIKQLYDSANEYKLKYETEIQK